MNLLQKKYQKSLARKKKQINNRLFDTHKTGRLKTRQKAEKEHQKRVLAEKLKVVLNTDTSLKTGSPTSTSTL